MLRFVPDGTSSDSHRTSCDSHGSVTGIEAKRWQDRLATLEIGARHVTSTNFEMHEPAYILEVDYLDNR